MKKKIKQTLKERDISPRLMAEDLGIRYQTITDWLNGSKGLKHEYLQMICDYLELELKKKS